MIRLILRNIFVDPPANKLSLDLVYGHSSLPSSERSGDHIPVDLEIWPNRFHDSLLSSGIHHCFLCTVMISLLLVLRFFWKSLSVHKPVLTFDLQLFYKWGRVTIHFSVPNLLSSSRSKENGMILWMFLIGVVTNFCALQWSWTVYIFV